MCKREGGSSRKWYRCQSPFDQAAGAESQYGVATGQSGAPRWRLRLGRLVHEGKRARRWRWRTEILRRQLLGGAWGGRASALLARVEFGEKGRVH